MMKILLTVTAICLVFTPTTASAQERVLVFEDEFQGAGLGEAWRAHEQPG